MSRVLARTGWRRRACRSSPSAAPTARAPASRCSTRCCAPAAIAWRPSRRRTSSTTASASASTARWCPQASLIAAFERIADALGPDSLTFFEFNTLAALLMFETAAPDVIVLEVGLGGRLDSVNVVDRGRRGRGLDRPRSHGVARARRGIHRPREGRHLPRRPAGRVRHAASHRSRCATARARSARRCRCAARISTAAPTARRAWDFVVGGQVGTGRAAAAGVAGADPGGQCGDGADGAAPAAGSRLPLTARGDRPRAAGRAPARPIPARRRTRAASSGCSTSPTIRPPQRRWPRNLRALPVPGRTLAVCGMLGDKDVPGVVGTLRGSSTCGSRRRPRARARSMPPNSRAGGDGGRRPCEPAGTVAAGDATRGRGRAARRPHRRVRFVPHRRSGARGAWAFPYNSRPMEEPLKARLIGASILVVLAVALVPELLSGPKHGHRRCRRRGGAKGTRTVTIDLGGAVAAGCQARTTSRRRSRASATTTDAADRSRRPAADACADAAADRDESARRRPRRAGSDGTGGVACRSRPRSRQPAASRRHRTPAPAALPGARAGIAVQVGAFGSAADCPQAGR